MVNKAYGCHSTSLFILNYYILLLSFAGKCLPEGLLDVTDCYYGFPIALSYPHFYQGDDVLFNKLEGLKPDKELHETRYSIII